MFHVKTLVVAALVAFLSACQGDALPLAETASSDSPAEVRTGYVFGSRGEIEGIKFEVIGGLAVREGDIVLGHADLIASSPEELKRQIGPRHGVYLDPTETNRWPGGVVPYIVSVSTPQRVFDAIAHVEANTPGIDFVPVTESQARANGLHYVRFVWQRVGCGSPIGRQGTGEQRIYLAAGCDRVKVIHEIGHTLGLQHEHMRCDRDKYVRILWHNIHYSNHFQFQIKCYQHSDFGTYSEGSIMHYPPYAFGVKGRRSIVSLRGRDSQMGRATGLNESDISTLSSMYPAQTQIHRWYNRNWAGGDHLYTLNPSEGWAHGYTLEDRDYFRVTSATGPHYAPLYRCFVNNHHYLSRSATCEVGRPAEGMVGRIATWQMGGTIPLYRTRNANTGDRLATTSEPERRATLSAGWRNEGILGYVWRGN